MAIVRNRPKSSLRITLRVEDRALLSSEARARNQSLPSIASQILEAALADLRQAPEFAVSPEDALQRRETEPRHIHRAIPRSPVI